MRSLCASQISAMVTDLAANSGFASACSISCGVSVRISLLIERMTCYTTLLSLIIERAHAALHRCYGKDYSATGGRRQHITSLVAPYTHKGPFSLATVLRKIEPLICFIYS